MRSRTLFIAAASATVAVVAIVWITLTPSTSPTAASATSGLTLDRLSAYVKSVGACHGTMTTATGKNVSAAAKKDHIIADFYCQNGHILSIVDVFSSDATRVALTGQKTFFTESYCAAHANNCAVSFEHNWVYLGLASNKDKGTQLAADQATLKHDAVEMETTNVDAKA